MGGAISRLAVLRGCCFSASDTASNATPFVGSERSSPLGLLVGCADAVATLRPQDGAGPWSEELCRSLHELHDLADAELADLCADKTLRLEPDRPRGEELMGHADQASNNQCPFEALDFYLGAYLEGAKEESLRGICNVARTALEMEAMRCGESVEVGEEARPFGLTMPPSPTALRLEAEIRRSVESFFVRND